MAHVESLLIIEKTFINGVIYKDFGKLAKFDFKDWLQNIRKNIIGRNTDKNLILQFSELSFPSG